jgi:hypothetical protein
MITRVCDDFFPSCWEPSEPFPSKNPPRSLVGSHGNYFTVLLPLFGLLCVFYLRQQISRARALSSFYLHFSRLPCLSDVLGFRLQSSYEVFIPVIHFNFQSLTLERLCLRRSALLLPPGFMASVGFLPQRTPCSLRPPLRHVTGHLELDCLSMIQSEGSSTDYSTVRWL